MTDPAESMVERVAQRIWDRYPWPQDYPTDEGIPPYFLDAARAAMEAMREPTEGMLESAIAIDRPDWRRLSLERAMWGAMIDAALAEGTEAAQVDTTPLG